MMRQLNLTTLKQLGVESNGVSYHRPADKQNHKTVLAMLSQLLEGLPESVSDQLTVSWGDNYSQLDILGAGLEITLHPSGCQLVYDTGDGVQLENLQISELALQVSRRVKTSVPGEPSYQDVLDFLNK